jgi:hypothetical protein
MTGIIMNIDIKNKNRRVTDLIGPRALCSASLRNRTGGSSDFLSSFHVGKRIEYKKSDTAYYRQAAKVCRYKRDVHL